MNGMFKEFGADQRELIHILHHVQAEYGYVPTEAIRNIARHLNISESDVYGVLTFYKAFTLKPRGRHLVTICMGTACHVRGAPRIRDEFGRRLGIAPGETSADNEFTLETVNCVGACALGPIAIADGEYHGQLKSSQIEKIIQSLTEDTKE